MNNPFFNPGPPELPGPPQGGAQTPEEQDAERQKCKTSMAYWIKHYCKTYHPFDWDNPVADFTPYDFQIDLIKSLENSILGGKDILIEKSRDMGVTWTVLLVFQWFWLFKDGTTFLLGSKTLDAVDRKGDNATLMEKLRFNLRELPEWMKPEGFSEHRHDNRLRMINPVNGNTIVGEAGGASFGRGGRYTAVFMDEFAYWRQDDLSFASVGHSTRCRIVVSTPHGKNNRFADLRFSGMIPVKTLHWRLHPFRDEAWYEEQCQRATEDEIARELDINYHLSSRDRVYRQFSVQHICKLQYNPHCPLIRSWDFGYHCATVLFLQVDPLGIINVLREVVIEQTPIMEFARYVRAITEEWFPGASVEDYADPAGGQKSDVSDKTALEILGVEGIYPITNHEPREVPDGIEIVRMALSGFIEESPALRVDEGCRHTIDALEGGYRYNPITENIIRKHPHADLMDCLRYAVLHKQNLLAKHTRRAKPVKARYLYRPSDRRTNY